MYRCLYSASPTGASNPRSTLSIDVMCESRPPVSSRHMYVSAISAISKLGAKVYVNPVESRELIRKDNNGKVGVYCWFNNVNGKFYVGSGDPLYMRLSDYYQD